MKDIEEAIEIISYESQQFKYGNHIELKPLLKILKDAKYWLDYHNP